MILESAALPWRLLPSKGVPYIQSSQFTFSGLSVLQKKRLDSITRPGTFLSLICSRLPVLTSPSLPRNTALLNNPTRLQQISERIPAGRWGKPEDFAGPVVFLASEASNYVCGELLTVDGVRYSFHDLHGGLTANQGWMGR